MCLVIMSETRTFLICHSLLAGVMLCPRCSALSTHVLQMQMLSVRQKNSRPLWWMGHRGRGGEELLGPLRVYLARVNAHHNVHRYNPHPPPHPPINKTGPLRKAASVPAWWGVVGGRRVAMLGAGNQCTAWTRWLLGIGQRSWSVSCSWARHSLEAGHHLSNDALWHLPWPRGQSQLGV